MKSPAPLHLLVLFPTLLPLVAASACSGRRHGEQNDHGYVADLVFFGGTCAHDAAAGTCTP